MPTGPRRGSFTAVALATAWATAYLLIGLISWREASKSLSVKES